MFENMKSLRVNLRKVRPVYMKVKSKCQSFSKLDITFDSLVLGDHFVEQLFGPGCPAYCGEQPIDTYVKKSSKSFLDYYSSKKNSIELIKCSYIDVRQVKNLGH